MSLNNRSFPTWRSAAKDQSVEDQLHLYNSLTRKKELFKTLDGSRTIKWYTCGPTVYDDSHMGHARCYMSFDIMRRILQDYFNYDIIYCMNITDIDDKIIIRARKRYLFDAYVKESDSVQLEKIVEDLKIAIKLTEEKAANENDKDKKEMYLKQLDKIKQLLLTDKYNSKNDEVAKKSADNNNNNNNHNKSTKELKDELIATASDILMTWLDKLKGKEITDNNLFSELPRHYESEFHKDMAELNILPASIVTRVSEYVPEIIEFIERIIKNGYAYESNGSVYFDTVNYDACKDHYYCKLVPEAFGDQNALAEGEGDLTDKKGFTEKRNLTDFALWKFSKPGEPSWDSPWGKGRPGWHIECSAMAGAIFQHQMDIHSGGVDLKFPHHDNEIAQSEAAFGNDNWVNFFVHSGHLHIQGCKMSKSLKNFITIKEALKKYTASQLRILFLMSAWKETLDFSDNAMSAVLTFEKTAKEFFLRVKDFLRGVSFDSAQAYRKFTDLEMSLHQSFTEYKMTIHRALCDSINTPLVMKTLSELISQTNVYMSSNYNKSHFNFSLLRDISLYITKLLKIFGVIQSSDEIGFQAAGQSQTANLEQTLMPYLNALSEFRDAIRAEARANKQVPILKLCDNIRDEIMPNLGVLLEDLPDRTVVKLVDKEEIQREKEQKRLLAEKRKEEAEKRKEELERAKREKEAKRAIPPTQMFLKETDKYSAFDENGFPIKDKDGKELSKSQIGKLQKLYDVQKRDHEEYLKSRNNSNASST